MHVMRQLFILLVTFFIFTIDIQANKIDSKASTPVTVQLSWKHQFQFAGFYMAIEQGIYKRYGLDVTLKEYTNETNVVHDVLHNKVDFGVGRTPILIDILQGKDLYLIMNHFQSSPHILLSKSRDDLVIISDLKNKKIMIDSFEVESASIQAMLKSSGITQNDFIQIPNSFDINQLINNKVDAISAYISNEPYFLEQQNIPYTIFNPSKYGFDFFSDILFCSEKFQNSSPELVDKFYRATKEGWIYAFKHLEETAITIVEKYNTQQKGYKHYLYEGNALKQLAYKDNKPFGSFDIDSVDNILRTYQLLNILNQNYHIEDLLTHIHKDSLYVPLKKLTKVEIIEIVSVVILLIVILLFQILRNRGLKKFNQKIKEQKYVIDTLLNSSSEGFLMFDKDGIINPQYSSICKQFFKQDISNKNILELLYSMDDDQKSLTQIALNHACEEKANAELYLEIIPKEIVLFERYYNMTISLKNNNFILILTDITNEKQSIEKAEQEKNKQQMILNIINDVRLYNELKDDFEHFIKEYKTYIVEEKDTIENINEMYRTIHTFKGLFAEFYIKDMVSFLHSLESQISFLLRNKNVSNQDLHKIIEKADINSVYTQSLHTIESLIGKELLEHSNNKNIDPIILHKLQKKVEKIHAIYSFDSTLNQLITLVNSLFEKRLYNLLEHYKFTLEHVSDTLHKNIHPLLFKIDQNIFVKDDLLPFLKSLIHIFRNTIDHGMEFEEERILKNKAPKGTIKCEAKIMENYLQLIIEDDGAGIDLEKIKNKAIELNMDLSNYTQEDILMLIFSPNISTKTSINSISGRGIGLNAVKSIADNMGISIEIESNPDIGCRFIFNIPNRYISIH